MKQEYMGFRPDDTIRIITIEDKRKDLEGKVCRIKFIDDAGQLHVDISSVALLPEIDKLEIISREKQNIEKGE